jgi:hypothetical protein
MPATLSSRVSGGTRAAIPRGACDIAPERRGATLVAGFTRVSAGRFTTIYQHLPGFTRPPTQNDLVSGGAQPAFGQTGDRSDDETDQHDSAAAAVGQLHRLTGREGHSLGAAHDARPSLREALQHRRNFVLPKPGAQIAVRSACRALRHSPARAPARQGRDSALPSCRRDCVR